MPRSQSRPLPGECRVREDPEEVADGRAHVLLRRLLEPLEKDRVGEVLRDPDALEEREVGLLEVARLPAREVVVDRQDDGGVAGGLCAPDDAGGDLVVVRPVELIPARSIAVRLRDLLERRRRGGARDQRQADRRRRTSRGELALLVEEGLDPDRSEHHRRRHPRAEQLHGEVAHGEVPAQDARHDPPAAEGLEVRAHRVLGAGAAEDVRDRAVVERLTRSLLELLPCHRQSRRLAGEHPLRVDLAVVVAERGRGSLGARHPRDSKGGRGASSASRVAWAACRSPGRRRRRCSGPAWRASSAGTS